MQLMDETRMRKPIENILMERRTKIRIVKEKRHEEKCAEIKSQKNHDNFNFILKFE